MAASVAGLAVAAGAAAVWLRNTPEALAGRCAEAVAAKARDTALTTCAAALDAVPSPENRLRMMRLVFESGDLPAAMAHARQLLDGPEAGAGWRMAGRVHERLGEAAQAREAFQKALERHAADGDAKEAAYDAHALAGSYWRAGEYRRALEALLRTQAEARTAGDERMLGYALLGVGTLLNQVGETRGAERAFEQATEHLGALTPVEQANLAIEHGRVQLESGRPALARTHFEEALTRARAAQSFRYERVALENLGWATLEAGDLATAAEFVQGGLALLDRDPDLHDTAFLRFLEGEIARRQRQWPHARAALDAASAAKPVPEMVWRIALEQGRVAAGEGRLPEAEAAYLRAIEAVEGMRRQIGVDELKRAFISAKRAPYEALFLLRAEAGRDREAADIVERALARSFLDAFLLPPEAAPPGPAGAVTLESSWNAAARRADQLKRLLSSLTASGVAAPVPVETTLARLGDRTVLAYYEAGASAWMLRWGGGTVTLRPLAAKPEAIARLADETLARLDDAAPAAALAAALELHALLPSSADEPLYFAPTGPLVRVPLAALRTPDGAPLVLRHPVVHVPSATALAAMLSVERPDYGPPVVLGDAARDLPQAAAEARAVAAALGVQAFLGEEAASARLQAAGRPSVLHVATHAAIGPSGPYLALADAPLDTGALMALHLDAELVVLASCASAAGDAPELWGSLASTFLAGGAQNVLATLRSVDDAATRRFVIAFYAAGGAREPARALAAVQRQLAKETPPSAWAHYLLMGTGAGRGATQTAAPSSDSHTPEGK